jgi:hypothetical protein
MKCPIESDKSKIEFPCLPETESAEVVLQLNNTSSKNYTFEVVPPKPSVSGIIVNPLFKPLPANKSTLVSIKYESAFRDLTYWTMQEMEPEAESLLAKGPEKGAPKPNKRIQARVQQLKEEKAEDAAKVADPKAKGGKAPAPAKKEEAKAPKGGKEVKKTPQQIEEEEAEEERKKVEAIEAEAARKKALEEGFDRTGELKKMGGRVYNFDTDEPSKRTQHYEWLLPVHFRNTASESTESQILYLQVRTTTVQRTLVANCAELDFGEIPVAFKKTQEILIKNVGTMDEPLQLQALTPFGGFSVLNAMRTIRPGETKPVVV